MQNRKPKAPQPKAKERDPLRVREIGNPDRPPESPLGKSLRIAIPQRIDGRHGLTCSNDRRDCSWPGGDRGKSFAIQCLLWLGRLASGSLA